MKKKIVKATEKQLYKKTLKVSGRKGSKKIEGIGTIDDLAKALKQAIPPTHGFVKVAELTGHAVPQDHLVASTKVSRGRPATVYKFG